MILFCSAGFTVKAYDLSHLLKPQLGLELNLIIPESTFRLSGSLPPALTQSMEYLTEHQVPFRIIYTTHWGHGVYLSLRALQDTRRTK